MKSNKDYDDQEGSGAAIACALLFVISVIIAVSAISAIEIIKVVL